MLAEVAKAAVELQMTKDQASAEAEGLIQEQRDQQQGQALHRIKLMLRELLSGSVRLAVQTWGQKFKEWCAAQSTKLLASQQKKLEVQEAHARAALEAAEQHATLDARNAAHENNKLIQQHSEATALLQKQLSDMEARHQTERLADAKAAEASAAKLEELWQGKCEALHAEIDRCKTEHAAERAQWLEEGEAQELNSKELELQRIQMKAEAFQTEQDLRNELQCLRKELDSSRSQGTIALREAKLLAAKEREAMSAQAAELQTKQEQSARAALEAAERNFRSKIASMEKQQQDQIAEHANTLQQAHNDLNIVKQQEKDSLSQSKRKHGLRQMCGVMASIRGGYLRGLLQQWSGSCLSAHYGAQADSQSLVHAAEVQTLSATIAVLEEQVQSLLKEVDSAKEQTQLQQAKLVAVRRDTASEIAALKETHYMDMSKAIAAEGSKFEKMKQNALEQQRQQLVDNSQSMCNGLEQSYVADRAKLQAQICQSSQRAQLLALRNLLKLWNNEQVAIMNRVVSSWKAVALTETAKQLASQGQDKYWNDVLQQERMAWEEEQSALHDQLDKLAQCNQNEQSSQHNEWVLREAKLNSELTEQSRLRMRAEQTNLLKDSVIAKLQVHCL